MNSASRESTPAADFGEVFEKELEQVRKRRRVAGQGSAAERGKKSDGDDLVGLALSGGGLRSAALSLGLLQSLSRNGLLRVVDYLSTVSGGGFAGGYFSSCSLKGKEHKGRRSRDRRGSDPDSQRQTHDEQEASAGEAFLPPGDFGKQPEQVRRFLFGGN